MTPRTTPLRATRRPFTLVVCTACAADGGAAALAALGPTIRRCDHGMLVTTGCLLGGNSCVPSSTRVTVALQPCTIDRRPEGRARWLGPLDGANDVRTLCTWLAHGDWDAPLSTVWDVRTRTSSRN